MGIFDAVVLDCIIKKYSWLLKVSAVMKRRNGFGKYESKDKGSVSVGHPPAFYRHFQAFDRRNSLYMEGRGAVPHKIFIFLL